MKQYRVKTADQALLDMENIYNYITEILLVPHIAMKQYDRIAEAIMGLKTFPNAHAPFDCEPERSLGMRKLYVDNYTVVFVVGEEDVTVLRVLYSLSDILARVRGEV